MHVELVYEKTCPNIQAARGALLRAFVEAGVPPRWQEWEVSAPDAPAHVHGYGSPTILVDGRDVSGATAEGDDYCCRIYANGEHPNRGVPPAADIVGALRRARPAGGAQNSSPLRLNAAMVPALGAAFLPKLACPACWPAYAGLLSALGVGFVDYTPYLLPLTAGFLLVALAALGYRARQRRGFGPLLLGALAGAVVVLGKFGYDSDPAMYAGLALLILASLWNTWPIARSTGTPCPACPTDDRRLS